MSELNPSPVTAVPIPTPPVPIPLSPILCIPSTYTSSPTANGWGFGNPFIGVSKKHVTIPEGLDSIELIPTPFELLIEIMRCCIESNPLTGAITCTFVIVWFWNIGLNVELSTTVLVTGLNNNKFGALVKSEPPSTISTLSTTSRLSIFTIEGINASGLSVLSAEYSYP